jgi:hypothetical protein
LLLIALFRHGIALFRHGADIEVAQEFAVGDIPGLAPDSKLVPARRLVNEAWLTIL